MTVVITLSLCGCRAVVTVLTDPETGTAESEKNEKIYSIAVEGDNAPYYSTDDKGKAQGIYVEIMDQIAREKGFAYTFVEMTASDFLNAAGQGGVSCFMGVLNEMPGEEKLLKSKAFLETGIDVVIRKTDADSVGSVEDLRACNMAARAYTGEGELAEFLAYKYETIPALFSDENNAMADFSEECSDALIVDEKYYDAHADENMAVLYTSENYTNLHRFSFSGENDLNTLLKKAAKKINVPEGSDEDVE